MVSNSTLLQEFDATVGNSMGVNLPYSKGFLPSLAPARAAFLSILAVLVFFSLPIWFLGSRTWAPVIELSIWGAIYFGWAVFGAQQTTSILRSLIGEIDSLLSKAEKQYIIEAIRDRFDRKRVLRVAVIAAILAITASAVALNNAGIAKSELTVVSVEFFLFYLSAAQATYVARFYGVFAEAIEKDPQPLSVLAPSQSPVIETIHAVGQTVVMFWFGIMVAVLTLGIFYRQFEVFVLIVVPIASFFSFVFGSAVYLMAERILRSTSRRAAAKTQLRLDHEVRAILEQPGQFDGPTLERLSFLSRLQADVTATKRPHGIAIAILSIVTPFAGPAVALIIYFLGRGSA